MDQPADVTWIFKILRPDEWLAFRAARHFEGSPDDKRDGFIHFSTAPQVPGTLARHFGGEGEVTILRVVTAPLGEALRWEPSRQGALFPHLFRPLRLEDVAQAYSLQRGVGGFDVGVLSVGY